MLLQNDFKIFIKLFIKNALCKATIIRKNKICILEKGTIFFYFKLILSPIVLKLVNYFLRTSTLTQM